MVSPLIEKSDANWKLADQLRKDGHFDAAANRFYYSLFQAVKAYAIKIGKMKETDRNSVHRTAKRIVCEERKDYKVFGDAMEMRERSDYQSDRIAESEFSQNFLNRADSLRLHYRKLAVA